MQVDAFLPANAATQTLSVTGASGLSAALGAGGSIEIQNAGTLAVFAAWDAASNAPTAAVATGYPILAGQAKIIRLPAGTTKIALIGAAAGPTTVYVTPGEGM
jgi:hypothetical protein